MKRTLIAACVAAFALASGLAGGGMVWARTSASQIDACVEARTGYLVLGRCAGQPLSWNVEGPAGPPGPPGPQGAPGATGPPGKGLEPKPASKDQLALRAATPKVLHTPSKPKPGALQHLSKLELPDGEVQAWSVYHDQAIFVPNALGTLLDPGSAKAVVAAHLDVPAGKYVVVAKAAVFRQAGNQSAEVSGVRCTLLAGADFDDAAATEWNTLSLTVVHSFAKPGRIELRCSSWGLVPPVLEDVKVTAIRVAALKNAYVAAGPLLTG